MVEYLDVERYALERPTGWETAMYDPLALDRQRIELERLRHRTESAPRRPDPTDSSPAERTGHPRLLRRSHRRAAAC
jgi:hypothetical protein